MTENDKKSTYRITDISSSDRPPERLARLGPHALSDAELLAILLRMGIEGENAVQLG
jgi:DNA repair protein RadC